MGKWKLETDKYGSIELPDSYEVIIGPLEREVPVYSPAGRPGVVVDTQWVQPGPREVRLKGRREFGGLEEADLWHSWLAMLLSSGRCKLYPRYGQQRYLEVVMRSIHWEHVGALVWEVEADLLAPEPFWLFWHEWSVEFTISSSSPSTTLTPYVNGTWWAWPKIIIQAIGGNVTNPQFTNNSLSLVVSYNGTLLAGQTLVLDPVALTAYVGSTGVVDKINLEWFAPLSRFRLDPGLNTVTFSASSVGDSAKGWLVWRDRWL